MSNASAASACHALFCWTCFSFFSSCASSSVATSSQKSERRERPLHYDCRRGSSVSALSLSLSPSPIFYPCVGRKGGEWRRRLSTEYTYCTSICKDRGGRVGISELDHQTGWQNQDLVWATCPCQKCKVVARTNKLGNPSLADLSMRSVSMSQSPSQPARSTCFVLAMCLITAVVASP